jgi:hypothetical protein
MRITQKCSTHNCCIGLPLLKPLYKMKKLLSTLLLLLVVAALQAQTTATVIPQPTIDTTVAVNEIKLLNTAYRNNLYIVSLDYETGLVQYPMNRFNRPRQLKVGQSLQFSIKNFPTTYKVSAQAELKNDKMENANLFTTYFERGLKQEEDKAKDNTTTSTQTTKKNDDSIKAADKKIEQQKGKSDSTLQAETSIAQFKQYSIASATKAFTNAAAVSTTGKAKGKNAIPKKVVALVYDSTINIKYKTNIDDIATSLTAGQTRNFLIGLRQSKKIDEYDSIGHNSSLALAIEDLNWQETTAFKNAQDNINDRRKRNEEMRLRYATTIDSLLLVIQKIKPQTTTRKLIGIQILNRDYANVEMNIKDEKDKVITSIPFAFSIRNGFKLDFSTGLFNAFQNRSSYQILNATKDTNGSTITIDSVYKIKESKLGNANLSVGILAHGYFRTNAYINFGLSFGFAYALETKGFNALAGGSLLLGREQRFILNAGLAYSSVQQLSLYKIEQPYHKSYLNSTTDLKLSSKLMPAFFFGISYNLGTIKTSVINLAQ